MKNYESSNVRSVALVGHTGCGKTSVAEAIAYLTELNTRLGSVSEGSSLMDYDPEEKDRGGSLASSFLSCEHDGYKIHVVDTPGDGDFLHDAYLCMQGVDGAVLVISAIDGVETATEKMNSLAEQLNVPRLILINKLDRDRADHAPVLEEIKEALGVTPVLLQLPIGQEDGFKGVVDLVTQQAYTYSDDTGKATVGDIPADLADDVAAATEALTEAVAESDDELLEKYFEEMELSPAEVQRGLAAALKAGSLVPVLLGSATRNIGVDRLLETLQVLPTPLERAPYQLAGGGEESDEEPGELVPDPNGPFTALCFKTIIDPFVGHLSIFRVVSGSGGGDASPNNLRVGKDERFGSMFHLVGKKNEAIEHAVPGDIIAVPKLKQTQTGDTLSIDKNAAPLVWHSPPEPMIAFVIKPQSRSDEDKVRGALQKVLAEDAGLRQSFDEVTKEIVLSGMGVNHITMSVEKMKRKYGVNVELGTPTIPYRETIAGKADIRYRHKKQTGGAGQFGEVACKFEPNKGLGFEFVNKVVGGVIPTQLIPSVEKGVRFQLEKGVLAGFPIVDVKVTLYDGKSHPVDSKDIAFQIAGRQCTKQAIMAAKPILLEPINQVEVVVPKDSVGDVMGDMNTRRARIQGMDERGRNAVVRALVPLAEMMNYAPTLKSITGGKGSYTMQFSSFEPVPHSMLEKLVAEVSRIKSGDDD